MQSEVYTPGHSETSISFMENRTFESHALFLKPYIRRGMKILDCGCGTGSITEGIAQAVFPGRVWGIDSSDVAIEKARLRESKESSHVEYQTGKVNQIPFEEDSFDGVFAHALFEHLSKPLDALREIQRVLKPGGFIALRSPDWGGFVLEPWNVLIAQATDAYLSILRNNGGDAQVGRKLAGYLRKSGFEKIEVSASYEVYPETQIIADYLASQLDVAGESKSAQTFRDWAQHPDAMFAQAWFEAVGFKP